MNNDIDYSLLPVHLQEGARRYIEQGIQPGGFLCAVICNDLTEAVLRADPVSLKYLKEIVLFFESEAPAACCGSSAALWSWIEYHAEPEPEPEPE